ncbi:hypothetical protein HDV05_004881 [Chytridiales sp. JEL 0842]|nr:hypothetical protein HDV05_004881 [Chytridiales sp. JEL 0842]
MVASHPPPIHTESEATLPVTTQDASKPKPPKHEPVKLEYLEGLRGIAAMHVVFAHHTFWFGPWRGVLMYGESWSFAVPCFFLLSGAVITIPTIATKDLRKLSSSFIRRFFRLLLPLWGFILVWTTYYAIFPDEEQAPGQASILDFWNAVTFLLGWSPYTRGIPGPAWTLPHEIFGSNLIYLMTAIMIPMHKHPKAKYIMLGVMIFFNWLGENWMNYFLAGLMLADMRHEGYLKEFQKWKYAHWVKGGLWFITAPFAFTYGGNPIRLWAEYVVSKILHISEPTIKKYIALEVVPIWISYPTAWILLMTADILFGWILTEMFDAPSLNFIKYWEAVFLMEDKWSWDLVFDWSKGKFKRTVEEVKTKVVLIRKAPARRWMRAKQRSRVSIEDESELPSQIAEVERASVSDSQPPVLLRAADDEDALPNRVSTVRTIVNGE